MITPRLHKIATVLTIGLAILFSGCAANNNAPDGLSSPPQAPQAEDKNNQLTGSIVGKSNKAKTVSIEVGKGPDAQTFMLRFDDKTTGIDDAKTGEAAIITWETRGSDRYAVTIKPKLAKLPPGVSEITADELHQLLEARKPVTVIDARPEMRYEQAHLPGAINIPVPLLKEKKSAVLPADKNRLLVFYCGGYTCGLTPASVKLAQEFGYTNIRGFLGGEPSWAEAGYPLYASHDFVEKGNIVLIDLRAEGKPIEGRIPRSIPISYEDLETRINDIPHNAPVVLYSDNDEDALEVLDELRFQGFKYVSLVEGNYSGWVSAGKPVVTGPVFSKEIKWVRQLGRGEVSVAEFRKAVNGELPDTYVIDARTDEEIAELGIFKNTVNIPLDEIPKRLNDIPKDKRIFIHCSTGARADLAYRELVKHGYQVKFLLLDISDPACDCPIIKP